MQVYFYYVGGLVMFKRVQIGNKFYDVQDMQYVRDGHTDTDVAIEKDGIVYPIRSQSNKNMPGIYPEGCMFRINKPDPDERPAYSSDKIIDFNNTKDVSEVIEKHNMMREAEKSLLATSSGDDIYEPVIGRDDSPEMKLMKECITAKQCVIKKYEDSVCQTFPNDIRKISNDTELTLKKLVLLSNALDIELTLTARDTGKDVANPMNKEVTIVLTGGDKE